jgi:protein-disulfide isomerase
MPVKVRSWFGAGVLMLVGCTGASAQFVGQNPHDNFRDTTILRPPAGAKVAILVWEDLGCPACAHWFPYENAAAAKYHVALVRRDFPLAQHIWTQQAAIDARYLQDHVSPQVADEYRGDVFKSQMDIASKDDLQQFTTHWFNAHKIPVPFELDPGDKLAAEVQADVNLANRLNVQYTPTVVVVTRNNYQVLSGVAQGALNAEDLDRVVQAAVDSVKQAPAPAAHKH